MDPEIDSVGVFSPWQSASQFSFPINFQGQDSSCWSTGSECFHPKAYSRNCIVPALWPCSVFVEDSPNGSLSKNQCTSFHKKFKATVWKLLRAIKVVIKPPPSPLLSTFQQWTHQIEEIKMDKAKEKEYEVTGSPKLISCVGIVRISIGNGKTNIAGNVQGNWCRKRRDCLPEGPHSLPQMPQRGAFRRQKSEVTIKKVIGSSARVRRYSLQMHIAKM